MIFHSKFALLGIAALTLSALVVLIPPPRAEGFWDDAPRFPVFRGREILAPDEAVKVAGQRGTIAIPNHEERFKQVAIWKSLFIKDCTDSCGWLTAESVLAIAAAAMGTPQPRLMRDIRSAFLANGGAFPEMPTLWRNENNPAPLQLLAIVNRLDLAQWDGQIQRWSGAEVRFVFASTGNAAVNVIVEFQYRPLTWSEFKGLANAWFQLGGCTVPIGTCFSGHLSDFHLAQASVAGWMDHVRLRTNSNNTRNGLWFLMQWNIGSGGLAPADIDDEIDRACETDPDARNGACAVLYSIWDAIVATKRTRGYPIPSSIGVSTRTYASALDPMRYILGKSEDEPRKLLSLQQCSNCHLKETSTDFRHVTKPTNPGDPVGVSPFISGNDPLASFQQLTMSPQLVGSQATVAVPCQSCTGGTKTVLRYFHDIGRRRLFLSAVVASDATFNDGHRKTIESYGPDFVH